MFNQIYKICFNCKVNKNIDNFYSKLLPYCKTCIDVYDDSHHNSMVTTGGKREKKAYPVWITKHQIKQIDDLHNKKRIKTLKTGIEHHLDHIHALNPPKIRYFEGELMAEICSFHIPCNLQIITAKANLAKKNSFKCYVHSDLDPNPKKRKSWEVI